MSNVTTDDVKYLAALSNIHLSDEEIESLQIDLSNILGYVDQLSELDTESVEPTYQVTGLENIWRDDEVVNHSVTSQQLVELAPDSQDSQVKVPKVL